MRLRPRSAYGAPVIHQAAIVPGSTLEGVTYYLPRTAFRVTVTCEKNKISVTSDSTFSKRY